MDEKVESLIIGHLEALGNELRGFKQETGENFMVVKNRLSSIEDQLVGIHADIAALNRRTDRIDERLTRIGRRSELIDA